MDIKFIAGVPKIYLNSLDGTNIENIEDVQDFLYDSETKKIVIKTMKPHNIPYHSYVINTHFEYIRAMMTNMNGFKNQIFSKYYIGNLIETYIKDAKTCESSSFYMEFEVIELRS